MSLLVQIVQKLRAANSIFDDRIAAVLSINIGEEDVKLDVPMAMVCPITEQASPKSSEKYDAQFVIDEMVRYRHYAVAMIFNASDGLTGEQAAIGAELGMEQIIAALVNWHPDGCYGPCLYDSMRVGEGSGTQGLFILNFTFIQFIDVSQLNQNTLDDSLAKISTQYAIVPETTVIVDDCVTKRVSVVRCNPCAEEPEPA